MSLEHYIIGGKGDERVNCQRLNVEDITIIENGCRVLYKFGYYDKREIEIRENLKEFYRIYELGELDILNKTDEELGSGIFNSIFININRTFTNYLSTYKIQIDHFDFHLKNKYGKDSGEYKKFEAHKRATYDAHFSHRLLYNLRNYSQHIYFPINNILKDSIRDGQGFKTVMNVSFDKRELLKDDYIEKKLGPDLNKCADYFPVMVHVKNSEKVLKDIYKMYLIIEKASLLENIDLIKKYTSSVPNDMEPLYGFWEFHRTGAICRTTIFPMDIIDRLHNTFSEMEIT